jgi:polyhydroxybutyrate depolymerase
VLGRWSWRRTARGVAAAAVVLLGLAIAPADAGTALDVPVVHDGAVRHVRLYVPDSLPLGERVPLLLVLHGLGASRESVARQTGFDAQADRHGFVVAYPEGRWGSWNAGGCCGDAAAAGVDDVGFLTKVVADLSVTAPVDPARVYLAGFSNGGMMALRAACERPDVFAAVASVTGTFVTPCVPSRPVSVMQVSGGRDLVVPYRGTAWSGLLRSALTAVPVTTGRWERGNACSGLPAHTSEGGANVRSYARCAGGSSVTLVVLPATAHAWPTRERDGWAASERIWDFLTGRTLPRTLAAPPRPALPTRMLAARYQGDVVGRLDGRYDVVIGRRLVVEQRRGTAWVVVASVETDVDGGFRLRAVWPGALRVRYPGGAGQPSWRVVA